MVMQVESGTLPMRRMHEGSCRITQIEIGKFEESPFPVICGDSR